MVRRIKAKLVLELRAEGMTGRAIALAQGMSRKSVLAVFDAAEKAGIGSVERPTKPKRSGGEETDGPPLRT